MGSMPTSQTEQVLRGAVDAASQAATSVVNQTINETVGKIPALQGLFDAISGFMNFIRDLASELDNKVSSGVMGIIGQYLPQTPEPAATAQQEQAPPVMAEPAADEVAPPAATLPNQPTKQKAAGRE